MRYTGSMKQELNRRVSACAAGFALPRYSDLPQVGLYLDQTVHFINGYFRDFPGVEELRSLAFSDIRGALKLGLEMTLAHLKEQGCEMSPASKRALDFLNQKG